jgi:hypothetical protein
MKSDKAYNLHRRMAALLDRLNIAQNAVTGPPPTRVSFSKLAELCARTACLQLDDVYSDLLQSYLSGAFEKTIVFYLTNLASDLTDVGHQTRREDFLIGYRMRRDFLVARARNYPTDHHNEATVLFNAYLGPCWIHRKAAVRWLESRDYPVPILWKQEKQPEELLTVSPKEKQNNRGRKFEYDWEEVELFVVQQLDLRGDFEDPGNAMEGWRCQANLENLVGDHMKKFENKKPAISTIRKHIAPVIGSWRAKRAADN